MLQLAQLLLFISLFDSVSNSWARFYSLHTADYDGSVNKSGQATVHSFDGILISDFIRELNLLRRPHRLGSDFTFEDQLSFILLAKLAVYSADLRSTRVIIYFREEDTTVKFTFIQVLPNWLRGCHHLTLICGFTVACRHLKTHY